MNALKILELRNESSNFNWSNIENKDFKLPLIFKCFHNIYNIDSLNKLIDFRVLLNQKTKTFAFYNHNQIPNLIINNIFKITDLESVQNKMLDIDDEIEREILKQNIISIAECSGQEQILLGVGSHNADKIYYYVRHKDEYLQLVGDNIFEFFKNFYVQIDEYYLDGVKFSQLYRNWGEDFWRVREDEKPV